MMIENHNDKREFEGRSDNGKLVHIASSNPLEIGKIYNTKITHAKNGALFGEVV